MISRLTTLAALFAVVTTASLAYAATAVQQQRTTSVSAPVEVIVLQRVEVTGKRTVSN